MRSHVAPSRMSLARSLVVCCALPGLLAACGARDRGPRPPADASADARVDAGTLPPGPCRPFDGRLCYTGPDGTANVGSCRQGLQECLPSGVWGPCEGEELPSEEDCTGDTTDEDCDGEANESGPSCVCAAGSWEHCWEGSDSARNVGACRDGQWVCDELGLGRGECTAAVLPVPEDCLRPFDEDCDGTAPACPTDWAITFGDVSTGMFEDGELIKDVATSADGDIVAVGTAAGAFELGGVRYENPMGADGYNAFVALFDSGGDVVWAKRFSDERFSFGRSEGTAAAIGPGGEIAIGGSMGGMVDFGGGVVSASGMFVAVYEPDGTHRFSHAFTGDDDDWVRDLAFDAAGNLYLNARASRSVDLGGGPLDGDSALASFDATGALRFSIAFSAGYSRMAVWPSGIAITGDGNPGLTNDFGGGPVGADFIAHFALDGTFEWAHGFDGYLDMLDVAAAPDGTVYAVGTTSTFSSFDGYPVSGVEDADLFIVEVAPGGAVRTVRVFGDGVLGPVDYGGPHEIEHTSDGRLLVTGSFDGTIDLGSGGMPGVGQEDHFVALLSTDASTVHYLQRFGTPERDYRHSLHAASDGTGAVVLGGYVRTPIDFGTGLLESRGSSDALLVRLSP